MNKYADVETVVTLLRLATHGSVLTPNRSPMGLTGSVKLCWALLMHPYPGVHVQGYLYI